MAKNYIYRMDHDTGFAPNTKYGICTLSGCMKTTVELRAEKGSWVVGIGGKGTGKPDKLIYAMEVEENLLYSEFKKRYPRKSKYLAPENAGSNVLISRKYYYFGHNAIDLPTNLKHMIWDRQGSKCIPDDDINTLRKYLSKKGYDHGIWGKPNNINYTKCMNSCVKNCHGLGQKGLAQRKPRVSWDSASQEVDAHIKQLKSDYKRYREPIRFRFRDTCSQWLKRSDKYTHMIHSYPAKLLPYIPIFFLFDPSYENRTGYLLDPFAGTGTVLLEGVIHPYQRMNSLGVEINPLARLISKVKTTPLDTTVLQEMANDLVTAIETTPGQFEVPQFPNIDFWFKKKAQRDLARIRYHIDCLEDSDYKDFFWVCFSSIIRRSSMADPKIAPPIILKPIVFSDKKQTERVRKQIMEKQKPEPINYFDEEIKKNIRRLDEFCAAFEDRTVRSEIVWDDVRTLQKGNYVHKGQIDKSSATSLSGVDLVITSPPYINAQKYIRTLKFELFWLGLIDYEDLAEMDKQFIGTERIYTEEYSKMIQVGEKIADSTIKEIYQTNKRRAGIVGTYYRDMAVAMKQIYDALNSGGRFILVVGNNLVCGKRVQNHHVLANIATQQIGFELEFIARDEIKSRGLITKRHETSAIISDEWIMVLNKN